MAEEESKKYSVSVSFFGPDKVIEVDQAERDILAVSGLLVETNKSKPVTPVKPERN